MPDEIKSTAGEAVDAAVDDGRLIQKGSNYYAPDADGEAGEHVGQGKAAAAEWLAAQGTSGAADGGAAPEDTADDGSDDAPDAPDVTASDEDADPGDADGADTDAPNADGEAGEAETLEGRYRYVGATTAEIDGLQLVTGKHYPDLPAENPLVQRSLTMGLLQKLP